MSLDYAILGFLNYQPYSGYDLKKTFDNSIQHFWPADQSQIYRTLARLAEQDLAEVEVVRQQDRPARKVYSITEAGREELRRWLVAPLPPSEPRHPQLIQVFFAGQLDDEEILTVFEREAERWRELLARYDQVPAASAEYVQLVGSPRETYFWLLTLECGIKSAEAQLDWVESIIERIRNGEIPTE